MLDAFLRIKPSHMRKFKIWGSIVVILALAAFVYFKFFFVFAEGVKAGGRNQFALKGYVFKTYEGKLIQTGLRGGNRSGSGALLESYNLEFSVKDPEIAAQLMNLSGEIVNLHYKEYRGALPWRGYTRYIVDEIVSVDKDATIQDGFEGTGI